MVPKEFFFEFSLSLDKINIITYASKRSKKPRKEKEFVKIEGLQNLGLLVSMEKLLENLRADPRVLSADYMDGKFHVVSTRGEFSFEFTAAEGEGTT